MCLSDALHIVEHQRLSSGYTRGLASSKWLREAGVPEALKAILMAKIACNDIMGNVTNVGQNISRNLEVSGAVGGFHGPEEQACDDKMSMTGYLGDDESGGQGSESKDTENIWMEGTWIRIEVKSSCQKCRLRSQLPPVLAVTVPSPMGDHTVPHPSNPKKLNSCTKIRYSLLFMPVFSVNHRINTMPSTSLIVKLPLPASLLERLHLSWQPNMAASASISAQLAPATTISNHFSQSQLSLALVISKSKPNGLSTAEYCQQLRKHIKHGGLMPIEHFQYIDTKQYWMDECNRIHKEKAALENKVRCLEEAQRILKERLRSKEHLQDYETHCSKSRNTQDHTHAEAGISRKRHALSQDVFEDQDAANLLFALDNDRHLQLNGQGKHCSKLLSAIENAENKQRRLKKLASSAATTAPDHTFFPRLLQRHEQSISHNTRTNEAKRSLSAHQSEDEQVDRDRSMRNKRQKMGHVEYAVNKCLTHTLVSIVKKLDWQVGHAGHSDILEGVLFLVIQHTGRLISDLVFGEHVAASDNPGNISNNPKPPTSGVPRPESRYMVQILHGALGGTERKELVIEVLSRSTSPGVTSSSGSMTTGDLLQKAKKLLQGTLLKSILGGPELESLRLPRLSTEISSVDDTRSDGDKHGKEWLLEAIWGLIGWDMVT
ncbi:hypothetical protein BKA64DRAFT_634012 [Cadophora sp. MPI-SDFR-AT-0126]|nr:hypothetical protein BKA64DRAFT_634012 [Leotiomycetes sp. MPI-SDFR-AT-0126]